MKRLHNLSIPHKDILIVFVTVGYPDEDRCFAVCDELIQCGVHCLELGFPFSDSLVDGPIIQHCNEVALAQGMNFSRYFAFVRRLREKHPHTPLVFMGSLNPVFRFGLENFMEAFAQAGGDAILLPDMPAEVYATEAKELARQNALGSVFLVTQRTSTERIRMLDDLADGFLYVVSSESTTGNTLEFDEEKKSFFQKLCEMKLRNPLFLGFGIREAKQREEAQKYFQGVIVGSALLKTLDDAADVRHATKLFVEALKI